MENIVEDSSYPELDIISSDEVCPVVYAILGGVQARHKILRGDWRGKLQNAYILSIILTFILFVL